jgi:hypothetical protein
MQVLCFEIRVGAHVTYRIGSHMFCIRPDLIKFASHPSTGCARPPLPTPTASKHWLGAVNVLLFTISSLMLSSFSIPAHVRSLFVAKVVPPPHRHLFRWSHHRTSLTSSTATTINLFSKLLTLISITEHHHHRPH